MMYRQPRSPGDQLRRDELQTIEQMDVAELARCGAAEGERFYRGGASDSRFAYELFRRALAEHNQLAWQQIYALYGPLVEHWVRRSTAFSSSGESSDYFVAAAFTRFWRAVSPERFAAFASLGALLQYLQRCTSCVVIDAVRSQSWAEVVPETMLGLASVMICSPDEEALEQVSREDFWKCIAAHLHSEAERVVVHASFVAGMKPAEIYERYARVFASIREVYSIKRNVLDRLSRNQELRALLATSGYATAA